MFARLAFGCGSPPRSARGISMFARLAFGCGSPPRSARGISMFARLAFGCGSPDYSFMCGSSQSRSALPMRLITSVVTKMARPGKAAIHHEVSM